MTRRNSPPQSLRRDLPPDPDAAAVARLRRRLVARRGFPRGCGVEARAARGGAEWFLGVDVRLASPGWVAAVAALPPRPRQGPWSAQGGAWLHRLNALQPRAQAERARTGTPWPPARL